MTSRLGPDRPFPGLRPYAEADHEWFFGRTRQTLALYRLLDLGRLVAVVGGSGSGKSSLVRAGLLPLLAKETAGEGGRQWRYWELRPGDAPIARLADALAGEQPADERAGRLRAARHERLDFVLRRSSFGLIDALRDLDLAPSTTPLVLVDQFEELFRFADLPGTEAARAGRREEAAAFVQLLLEAMRSSDLPVRIVLTMRSDYLGDCARFHGLPEAVTGSQFLVPSLTRDQREEAIRGPIRKAGGIPAEDLVERLLNDSTEELDQLPVLQHVLNRTWHHTRAAGRKDLVLDDYRSVGGITDAISGHADTILREPSMREREFVVEQVFRALTELDRLGRGVRRPLTFGQLVAETGLPEADVRVVVDRFRQEDCSFLVSSLVPEHIPLASKNIIDIGHESLIRRWRRLSDTPSGWLQAELQDGLAWRLLVEQARAYDRDSGNVLPAATAEERRRWIKSRNMGWSTRYGNAWDNVYQLIETSWRIVRWRAKRDRIILFVLAGLFGISTVLAYVAYNYYQTAQERLDQQYKLIASLVWNGLVFNDLRHLTPGDRSALWRLAKGDRSRIQVPFKEQLQENSQDEVSKFGRGYQLIVRALGGSWPNVEAAESLLPTAIHDLSAENSYNRLWAIALAIEALASNLSEKSCDEASQALLKTFADSYANDQTWALASALGSLAPRLTPKEATIGFDFLKNKFSIPDFHSQRWAFAFSLRGFSDRLPDDRVDQVYSELLNGVAGTDVAGGLWAFAQAIEKWTPRLSRDQRSALLRVLLDKVDARKGAENTDVAKAITALAEGSDAAAELNVASAIQSALERLEVPSSDYEGDAGFTEFLKATAYGHINESTKRSAQYVYKAIQQLNVSAAKDALRRLIAATARGGESYKGTGTILDEASKISGNGSDNNLPAESVKLIQDALDNLSLSTPSAFRQRFENEPSALLAQGLTVISRSLKDEDARSRTLLAERMLGWASGADAAAAWSEAIIALQERTGELQVAAEVAKVLRYPTTGGRATEVLLDGLRQFGGPGSKAGFAATIQWLAKQYPSLDVTADPECPSPVESTAQLYCPTASEVSVGAATR